MNALAIHLYLTIRYINLIFNYFGNFYRIIDVRETFFFNQTCVVSSRESDFRTGDVTFEIG